LVAPAKLTLSLSVLVTRPDGLHDLSAEMVSLNLADELFVRPGRDGLLAVTPEGAQANQGWEPDSDLIARALTAVGRRAAVRVVKRIPVGGGLGGGSSDAGAILRWAGCSDSHVALNLGADVPFCVAGGRARVTGAGEHVEPLPFVARSFVLLIPPIGTDTAAVYRAYDRLSEDGRLNAAGDGAAGVNELTAAALDVEPRLAPWRDLLGEATGRVPVLAGSGSTWFVEGTPEMLGVSGRTCVAFAHETARLVAVQTVPAGWEGPVSAS